MTDIKNNLRQIHERLEDAARRASRDLGDIKLLAVSKHIPWQVVKDAVDCGQTIFGENYVQEGGEKIKQLAAASPQKITWHFIGHLQSNKAKQVAEQFQVIETIDRLKLARALDSHLASLGRTMDVFIQVNIGKELQKSGILPDNCENLLEQISECRNLRVTGLMTMPPFSENPEESRPYFRKLRTLAERLHARGLLGKTDRPELSMGMSGDFEVAVEEGSTIIRVGTAIFGSRK